MLNIGHEHILWHKYNKEYVKVYYCKIEMKFKVLCNELIRKIYIKMQMNTIRDINIGNAVIINLNTSYYKYISKFIHKIKKIIKINKINKINKIKYIFM
jgi:hypothetical protein